MRTRQLSWLENLVTRRGWKQLVVLEPKWFEVQDLGVLVDRPDALFGEALRAASMYLDTNLEFDASSAARCWRTSCETRVRSRL